MNREQTEVEKLQSRIKFLEGLNRLLAGDHD